MLRKTARFDTAQNEFFPDKKGTGGEKSRIFLNGDSPGVHFLTNTIPYRFPNCNVSFFTKKIPADPQTVRCRGGTGPGQGRETEKWKIFQIFSVTNLHFAGKAKRRQKSFSVKNLHLSAAHTEESRWKNTFCINFFIKYELYMMPARREGRPERLCGCRWREQSAVLRAGIPQCGTVATMSCVRPSQNRRRKQHPVKYRQKNTGRNVKECRNGVAGIQNGNTGTRSRKGGEKSRRGRAAKKGEPHPHRSSISSEMPKNWAISFSVRMLGSMRPRS